MRYVATFFYVQRAAEISDISLVQVESLSQAIQRQEKVIVISQYDDTVILMLDGLQYVHIKPMSDESNDGTIDIHS